MKKFVIGIILFLVLCLAGCPAIGFHNKEVSLRNGVMAQQDANRVVFDRVWKVIQQTAQVPIAQKEAFQDIYTDIMQNSDGGGDNRLLVFIQSVNPQFDQSSFTNLQTIIEANRRDFDREQRSLVEKNKQHKDFIQKFPNNIYAAIFGRNVIDITLVTSARTEESFRTGQENDIDLFNQGG